MIYLTERFEYTISDRSFSESETKKIFADAGIDWQTRAERYKQLKNTKQTINIQQTMKHNHNAI